MSTFMRGKKCELRILEESDEEARAWTNGVMGNITLQHLLTGSIPMRWIEVQDYWRDKRKKGAVHWGIWIARNEEERGYMEPASKFVGVTGLYDPYEVYRSYEFRIIIFAGEELGKGIGQEATWMVTDYAFRRLNSHRVWLGVNEENAGAVKCYENVGYKLEGVLRDAIYCYGKYSGVKRYAILRHEWEEECRRRELSSMGPLYA